MALEEWNERYSVGIKELDEQHCQLFSIFYTLLEAGDIPQKAQEVADALAGLSAYTYEHFATEERYMAEWGYPGLANHIRIHNAFCKKVEALRSAKMANKDDNLMEILSTLYEWLITHVYSCDRQYLPYVAGQKT